MTWMLSALTLLGGAAGAGFASGREIVCFFARHGSAAGLSVLLALASMSFFFMRLPALLHRCGCASLTQLCRVRFGARLGALCALLFYVLCAVTGGAMLAACAELGALTLRLHHAYALTLAASLALGVLLSARGVRAMALPGALLLLALPALLVRLLALPAQGVRLLPAQAMPVCAAADGLAYGALNAAMLAGCMPLLPENAKQRKRIVLSFALLFGTLLALAVAVCLRHLPAVLDQPLPFVFLGRQLGCPLLIAVTLYAAALSTLCAMLSAMAQSAPFSPRLSLMLAALSALGFARLGFGRIVKSGYPVLGAVCAGLLLLLCLPSAPHQRSSSSR